MGGVRRRHKIGEARRGGEGTVPPVNGLKLDGVVAGDDLDGELLTLVLRSGGRGERRLGGRRRGRPAAAQEVEVGGGSGGEDGES